jgi:hypothetical protein
MNSDDAFCIYDFFIFMSFSLESSAAPPLKLHARQSPVFKAIQSTRKIKPDSH